MSKTRSKIVDDLKNGNKTNINQHLYEAMLREDDLLNEIIEAGANVNTPNKEGELPVFVACRQKPELLEFLMQNGVNINVQETDGTTPLMIVSMYYPKRIKSLINYGAKLDTTDDSGQTALAIALETNAPESVQELLPYYPNTDLEYLKVWEEAYHEEKLGHILQQEIIKKEHNNQQKHKFSKL